MMKPGERFCWRRSVLDKRRDARFYYEFANDLGGVMFIPIFILKQNES